MSDWRRLVRSDVERCDGFFTLPGNAAKFAVGFVTYLHESTHAYALA